MGKYSCSICGFIYDEEKGIHKAGISPGTEWKSLPDSWTCPLCGAGKSEFEKQGNDDKIFEMNAVSENKISDDVRELSILELSALCTNLARGCEKQYKHEEASLFMELANYFKKTAPPTVEPDFSQLFSLIEKDIEYNFPNANSISSTYKDRGALRALMWSEKVTRILKSLLIRYQSKGDAMYENTGVYVCTICGFIYIGDTLPDVCPVCKVPNWKFERVEGR